jgi:competence protein ComGC
MKAARKAAFFMRPERSTRWYQITLIEFFVIALIVAVLLALLIPAMQRSSSRPGPPPAAPAVRP